MPGAPVSDPARSNPWETRRVGDRRSHLGCYDCQRLSLAKRGRWISSDNSAFTYCPAMWAQGYSRVQELEPGGWEKARNLTLGAEAGAVGDWRWQSKN